jgi:hypothetical protein
LQDAGSSSHQHMQSQEPAKQENDTLLLQHDHESQHTSGKKYKHVRVFGFPLNLPGSYGRSRHINPPQNHTVSGVDVSLGPDSDMVQVRLWPMPMIRLKHIEYVWS